MYTIKPFSDSAAFDVYCDMTNDDGGWITIQKRKDGSTEFFNDWQTYVDGFGDKDGEYWLGLDKIHKLTKDGNYELRIDLEDFETKKRFAKYSSFMVGAGTDYTLTVSGYSGDAVDSFAREHNGMKFSTKDKDQDKDAKRHCAQLFKGAWWYSACHWSNLNGQYLGGAHDSWADGVNWYKWVPPNGKTGHNYSLKITEMKIRKKT